MQDSRNVDQHLKNFTDSINMNHTPRSLYNNQHFEAQQRNIPNLQTERDAEIKDIKIELLDADLWTLFHNNQNEMIVTKEGRRMFPVIKIGVSGLKSNDMYSVHVDFIAIDKHRWKFVNGQWVRGPKEEIVPDSSQFIHSDSPNFGHYWMKTPISFSKLKITNKPNSDNFRVQLQTLFKYQPRIHIFKHTNNSTEVSLICTVSFVTTEFVAVTAYQNDTITKLKVENNPFAKAFLDAKRNYNSSYLPPSQQPQQQQQTHYENYNNLNEIKARNDEMIQQRVIQQEMYNKDRTASDSTLKFVNPMDIDLRKSKSYDFDEVLGNTTTKEYPINQPAYSTVYHQMVPMQHAMQNIRYIQNCMQYPMIANQGFPIGYAQQYNPYAATRPQFDYSQQNMAQQPYTSVMENNQDTQNAIGKQDISKLSSYTNFTAKESTPENSVTPQQEVHPVQPNYQQVRFISGYYPYQVVPRPHYQMRLPANYVQYANNHNLHELTSQNTMNQQYNQAITQYQSVSEMGKQKENTPEQINYSNCFRQNQSPQQNNL